MLNLLYPATAARTHWLTRSHALLTRPSGPRPAPGCGAVTDDPAQIQRLAFVTGAEMSFEPGPTAGLW